MFFKESSWNPLINSISDIENKEACSSLIFLYSSLDGFKEEFNKAFKWILIHMINDTEWDT